MSEPTIITWRDGCNYAFYWRMRWGHVVVDRVQVMMLSGPPQEIRWSIFADCEQKEIKKRIAAEAERQAWAKEPGLGAGV